MLVLANTTDKLQLLMSTTSAVDVVVSYVEADTSSPPAITEAGNRQLTAITTGTVDILAAPASSTRRNVKELSARNTHASTPVTVSILYNANGTTYVRAKATLAVGECLEYIEGLGWKLVQATGVPYRAAPLDSDLSFSDITTNNSSTSTHGFLKKLDNSAAHFMNGTGAWSTPAGTTVAVAIDAFANRPANTAGQIFFPNDGGFQQIGDGTNWWNVVNGSVLREPPATATIATQTNFGTSNLTKTNGVLVLVPQQATGPLLRLAGKTIVTIGSAVVTAGISLTGPAANYNSGGVYMRESGTGKILSWSYFNASSTNLMSRGTWTSATARASNTDYSAFSYGAQNGGAILQRLAVSGSNILLQFSYDGGLNFLTIATIAKTTPFTTAPDEFGICSHVENVNTPAPAISFFTLTFAGD